MFTFPRGLLIHARDTSAPGGGGHVKPLVTKGEISVAAAPEQQQTLGSVVPSRCQL